MEITTALPTPAIFDKIGKDYHYILLFGGLDRVFPLLRTIFHDSADKYMNKIIKSIETHSHSLSIRMQLLLWLNFMHCIVPNTGHITEHMIIQSKNKLNEAELILTPDLIQIIQIDAALEQTTNIGRLYPLERDAFHVLRIESSQNEQIISKNTMDYTPSKYIEKLLSLLLIFKPNFNLIFDEYYIDIVMIIKRERNPIQCLEIMYFVLQIDDAENKKAFMSLVNIFIPNICYKSPLYSQNGAERLLKLNNDDNDKKESQQYEVIAMKHRLSVLNKENQEMKLGQKDQNEENKELKTMLKQKQLDLDLNTRQYMDTIKMLTKQSKTTQNELQLETVSNQAMIQTINVITDKNKKTENECIQLKDKLNTQDKEIERLKQQIKGLKETQNVDKKRYRPFLGDFVEKKNEMKDNIIDIDSDALKIDLLNYIKYIKTAKNFPSLVLFHEIKPQIILNWRSLKSQFYDDLMEELMDFYEESIAYNIGYKLILECYNFISKCDHSYNAMVFNVIYLNLPLFYGFKMNNKIGKMLSNVYTYLDVIIDAIYKKDIVHLKEMDSNLKQRMNKFIMHCCNILWSAMHYGYDIGPNDNSNELMKHTIFNDSMHKKENSGCGNVDCFVFPSLYTLHENGDVLYETHIWVYCSEL